MQIIDWHCDTIGALAQLGDKAGLKKNTLHVDIEKLKRGEVAAQFFALFVDAGKTADSTASAMKLLERFQREMTENAADIAFAASATDFWALRAQGRIAAFLTLEEGGTLGGKIENLQKFYRLGVRLITLTWNYPNALGFPNCDFVYRDRGLTPFGRACVAEMNRLGMIVDVSHLSDQGFYDVAQTATRPFVASHSNARAVWEHPRNLTDDMIRTVAQCGGVVGVNFCAHFLSGGARSLLADITRHIRHIYRVGGSDTAALGSDFDGIHSALECGDCGGLQQLMDALRDGGFTETEIEKIACKNALRVIEACL